MIPRASTYLLSKGKKITNTLRRPLSGHSLPPRTLSRRVNHYPNVDGSCLTLESFFFQRKRQGWKEANLTEMSRASGPRLRVAEVREFESLEKS